MKRIRLVVAYDGTAYCGWQIQANGRTVEEMLNKALSRITGEDIHVQGASRTDAGVHALGNIAIFDTDTKTASAGGCFAAVSSPCRFNSRVLWPCDTRRNIFYLSVCLKTKLK